MKSKTSIRLETTLQREKFISPIDNTINNVNSDKDIGVASRISTSYKKDVMGDFCIGKPRQSNRSVIPPKRLNDYFCKGKK
ncbi:hypothetical protein KY284_010661 [Solanum tuberosum]|nr:hypothetical protein KY284_010661 [Solanum tuberosum]